ncbi:MAG: anthranilate synthase component I [Pseudomonadota bacterium]
MDISPSFEGFSKAYAQGAPQVVSTTLVADLETPVSAMLKLADQRPYSFLFESVEGGAIRGRYSAIGLKPDLIWRSTRGKAEINRNARADLETFEPEELPPLDSLHRLHTESRIELPEGMPPIASGLFGYLGYDMVRHMERLPDDNPDTLNVPDSVLMRPTIVAVFDNIEDKVTLVTPVWPRNGLSAEAAYQLARERLADVVADFERSLPYRRDGGEALEPLPEPVSNTGAEAYREAVEKAKEYIRAGDIFQVVPSQRFTVPFRLPPLSFYRALRRLNPSPFLFYLDFGGFSIVGSSPEILVRVRDDQVTIRPLAGTRRRGVDAAEDTELAADLLADPKERAEHLMLLDLGRNDVGRVAEIGSVEVTDQFKIEYYSHVMHIVSNVEGRLAEGKDALDALIGGFPAGTVSGAPKVRAMEIIDELEVARRGVYAGAVGYFGANGDLDTCIALRTGVIEGGKLHIQAGGGVVADSDPDAELEETRQKARALVRAAQEAIRFAGRR